MSDSTIIDTLWTANQRKWVDTAKYAVIGDCDIGGSVERMVMIVRESATPRRSFVVAVDVETGSILQARPSPQDNVGEIDFANDANIVALVNFDTVVVCSYPDFAIVRTFVLDNPANSQSVCLFPDGKRVYIGSERTVFDIATGASVWKSTRDVRGYPVLSENGKYLSLLVDANSDSPDYAIILDALTGDSIRAFTGRPAKNQIFYHSFSPDGKYFGVERPGYSEGQFSWWNGIATVYDVEQNREVSHFTIWPASPGDGLVILSDELGYILLKSQIPVPHPSQYVKAWDTTYSQHPLYAGGKISKSGEYVYGCGVHAIAVSRVRKTLNSIRPDVIVGGDELVVEMNGSTIFITSSRRDKYLVSYSIADVTARIVALGTSDSNGERYQIQMPIDMAIGVYFVSLRWSDGANFVVKVHVP